MEQTALNLQAQKIISSALRDWSLCLQFFQFCFCCSSQLGPPTCTSPGKQVALLIWTLWADSAFSRALCWGPPTEIYVRAALPPWLSSCTLRANRESTEDTAKVCYLLPLEGWLLWLPFTEAGKAPPGVAPNAGSGACRLRWRQQDLLRSHECQQPLLWTQSAHWTLNPEPLTGGIVLLISELPLGSFFHCFGQ